MLAGEGVEDGEERQKRQSRHRAGRACCEEKDD
jgi:hypothetical protein